MGKESDDLKKDRETERANLAQWEEVRVRLKQATQFKYIPPELTAALNRVLTSTDWETLKNENPS